MTVYSIKDLFSDLSQINGDSHKPLKEIRAKIGANYPKREFLSDLSGLFDFRKTKKVASQIINKIKLIHTERAILFLAEKYYAGEFKYAPQEQVNWDKDRFYTSDVVRHLDQKQFEREIQRLLKQASELEGYPTISTAIAGIVAGSFAFSSAVPAFASGAAAALIFKAYKIYQALGDPTRKIPPSPPTPGLRCRKRHI